MRGKRESKRERRGEGGIGEPPVRLPFRPRERRVRGAQPPGMQWFGGAAPKVHGVRGAQPPGMQRFGGAAPNVRGVGAAQTLGMRGVRGAARLYIYIYIPITRGSY